MIVIGKIRKWKRIHVAGLIAAMLITACQNTDKEVKAYLGYDDQVRVRLNDEVVYKGKHEAGFEETSFPLKLKKGNNRILIKLSNYDNTNWKWWTFSFRYE